MANPMRVIRIVVLVQSVMYGGIIVSGPSTCQQGASCTYSADGGIGPYIYHLAPGSVGSIDPNTGVYAAPPHIAPIQSYAGCQVHPNNHIFNTRIDQLPVHPSNATWMRNLIIGSISVSYQIGLWGNP